MSFLHSNYNADESAYEPTWQLFSKSTHRARTAKNLGDGDHINIGQLYTKTVGLLDGEFTVYMTPAFDKARFDAAVAAGRIEQLAHR